MYNADNFKLLLTSNPLSDLIIGGIKTFTFQIQNTDVTTPLYNLSLQLTLQDGISLIDSTIPYTLVSNGSYSFTNIKDLAPNEISYTFTITLQLNTNYEDDTDIPFDTIFTLSFEATTDTMPRGSYDHNNQIISANTQFKLKATSYTIYKMISDSMLLGNDYDVSVIIQTAHNATITISQLTDILENGFYLSGDITITGSSSSSLTNYTIATPIVTGSYYRIDWTNIVLPANTIVTISYKVSLNERYYKNGVPTGNYIANDSKISTTLSWFINSLIQSESYTITAFEFYIYFTMNKYYVDINQSIKYTAHLIITPLHSLFSISGFLVTSDGQQLSDISIPMFTSKFTSTSGITQITWNIGNLPSGASTIVEIDGTIATTYIDTGLPIYSGDTFTIHGKCNAISSVTNQLITTSADSQLQITVPSVAKEIVAVYHSDLTPKSIEVAAPGDIIEYKSTIDSLTVVAPSRNVKLFDYFPFMTMDVMSIAYQYSSPTYPGGTPSLVPNYGVMWYLPSMAGGQVFDISYQTKLQSTTVAPQYTTNLFKLNNSNSYGIANSSRSQASFSIGQPNLSLNKQVDGFHITAVRIGEVYTITTTLTNIIGNQTTDAFHIIFIETLPDHITLVTTSITATINSQPITTSIGNNTITTMINQLSPGSKFTLTYQISIDDTLGPNTTFPFTSSSSAPYSQEYLDGAQNYQYTTGALSKTTSISSAPLTLSVTSDFPTKQVGENVTYSLSLTIPIGQKLTSITGLILIPTLETWLNEATLNNQSITAIEQDNIIMFPSVTSIDTTTQELTFLYRIKCFVADVIVSDGISSSSTMFATIEPFYGNISYTTYTGINNLIGVSNTIQINHPYINLTIGSSNTLSNVTSQFRVSTNPLIFTQILATNQGYSDASNLSYIVKISEYITFTAIINIASGVSYTYDSVSRTLSITIDFIPKGASKSFIFTATIQPNIPTNRKEIMLASVQTYTNEITNSKLYTSNSIANQEIYVNSIFTFTPLSRYKVEGTNSAINLSQLGVPTKIEYWITNNGLGIDSFTIKTTPILYQFDVYISNSYVTTILPNTPGTITNSLLNNLSKSESRLLSLRYTIPFTAPTPCYQTMLISTISQASPTTIVVVPTTLQDP